MRKTREEAITEFMKAMASAVEWFRANCDPYQRIIIDWDGVKLMDSEKALR